VVAEEGREIVEWVNVEENAEGILEHAEADEIVLDGEEIVVVVVEVLVGIEKT